MCLAISLAGDREHVGDVDLTGAVEVGVQRARGTKVSNDEHRCNEARGDGGPARRQVFPGRPLARSECPAGARLDLSIDAGRDERSGVFLQRFDEFVGQLREIVVGVCRLQVQIAREEPKRFIFRKTLSILVSYEAG